MADPRTTITELVTGLGMLGDDDVATALSRRPPEMVSVSPALWDELDQWHGGPAMRQEFEAAFANGRAFLSAPDALRGRVPAIVDWRGNAKPVDDELVPADLRIDHVYLVSCKYLSLIVGNAAPGRLFDGLLRLRTPSERTSWFDEVAPDETRALLEAACGHADVPVVGSMADLAAGARRELRDSLRGRAWPEACQPAWAALVEAVSTRTVERWRRAIGSRDDRVRLLWRLLRIGPVPYFVLGVSDRGALRLRVQPSWDWSRRFELDDLAIRAKPGGQPMVEWEAAVGDRVTGRVSAVRGHVEIRWSHGRFSGAPEAKIYLGTPHADLPGYVPLDRSPA